MPHTKTIDGLRSDRYYRVNVLQARIISEHVHSRNVMLKPNEMMVSGRVMKQCTAFEYYIWMEQYETPTTIDVPIFSDQGEEDGFHEILGYRKEYVG